jgi:hypothetical protein
LGTAAALVYNASGDTILTANLTHSQETTQGTFQTSTGDPRPESFGSATFVLNDAMTQMSFTATIFNIDVTGTQTPDPNDNLVAAHIHANATVVVGQNAGVVWGFFGAPDNDNNPDNLVVTPFSSGVGGTFSSVWDAPEGNGGTTLAAQLPNILSGHSYINFHTVQFGGGEIRGALNVPDQGSTLALFGCALLGMFGLRRSLARPAAH